MPLVQNHPPREKGIFKLIKLERWHWKNEKTNVLRKSYGSLRLKRYLIYKNASAATKFRSCTFLRLWGVLLTSRWFYIPIASARPETFCPYISVLFQANVYTKLAAAGNHFWSRRPSTATIRWTFVIPAGMVVCVRMMRSNVLYPGVRLLR